MGNCPSNDPDKVKSDEISKDLKSERKKQKIKLLLLGAGESGKSTIAKQMKIIHLGGYTADDEKVRFAPVVYNNILTNIKALLTAAQDFKNEENNPKYELQDGEAKEAAKRVFATEEDVFRTTGSQSGKGLGSQLTQDIKRLWDDPAIQASFKRASEFQLGDSAEYFFSNIDRISVPEYIPDVQDVLRVRAKTTGINELEFKIGTYHFNMTDVGGQRSERRKWIHCFEDVTAIIFCAALSEYDQKLYEDETTNRMMEALRLFSDITNSKWFDNTPIILFLNKRDIFEEKIKRVPLSVCFPEYQGKNDFQEASDYIEQQFIAQITNQSKLVYTYKTCATDTNNVRFIFKAVKDVFITVYLMQMGFLSEPTGLPSPQTRTNTVSSGQLQSSDRRATSTKKIDSNKKGEANNNGNDTT